MIHAELDELPVFCEKCGYHLNALPATVCAACALVGLRCPECGHRQHANSARPAVLRAVGRLRGLCFFLAAVVRLALCALAGGIWMVVGIEWSRIAPSPQYVWGHPSYVLLALGAVVTGLGLRLVLVPAAWRLLPILAAIVIPAGAYIAGVCSARWADPVLAARVWTFSLTVLPWMIVGSAMGAWHMRLWTWAMWPAPAQWLLGRWRTCRAMPRIDLDRANPPRQTLLGEPLPLFCERCAAPIHSQPIEHCGECSLPAVACPQCAHHTAVRSVRPVLEQVLARVTANTLHLLTFVSVTVLYIALFGWFVFGYETLQSTARFYGADGNKYYGYYAESFWIECMIAAAFAGVFGFCWRLILLRWRWGLLTGLAAGGITAGAMVAGACYYLLSRHGAGSTGAIFLSYEFLRAVLAVTIAVILGCASGWPILRGFIQLVTPKRLSTRLLSWRQSGLSAELIVMYSDTLPMPAPNSLRATAPATADAS